MAKVDTNLLARLGFVMKADGGGEKITIGLRARINPPSDPNVAPAIQTGWADIDFSVASALSYTDTADAVGSLLAPLSVSPSVEALPRYPDDTLSPVGADIAFLGVRRFMQFVANNPIHVTNINLRASSVETIPQQIIVLTPDIAGGQMSRQIIDVAARKNAYQYQNNIITIDDLDLYIGRDSIIRFEGSFSHTLPVGTFDSDLPCYMDLTIDRYISLEKALVENIKLLATATGQADAITQEVAKAEAVSAPNTLTLNTGDVNPAFNANLVQGTIYPSIPQFQSKKRR